MKKQLDKTKPKDFEELGYETMRKCYDVEQAAKICAPVLHAYELALRPKLQQLHSEIARVKNQASALHNILYDRPVPVSDAQMLAHTRKIQIVAFFAVLTGLACLVGNVTTFLLWGFGLPLAFLFAIGMTAFPLGIGHLAYEWLISATRWARVLVVLVATVLATAGIVLVGHARTEMVDRSISTPMVNSYVDGQDTGNSQPMQQSTSGEGTESKIHRTLGEGLFLIVLAAELALAFLVGRLIELYGDNDNTTWRKLQSLERELSALEVKAAELAAAPEIAKKCCLAGILRAENARPRRHPPYHRALTLILVLVLLFALPVHAQTVDRYEGILIDTSRSISRGGRTNDLFHDYLIGTRKLLLTEPSNTRVWVASIATDSFGGTHEILKGWTPDARGVFTDDLNRARLQLASAFEVKSTGMAPLASATDIFGGLWRLKAMFEAGSKLGSATSVSKTIWIFSDMMNETKAFPMPELLELGPQQMLERAKGQGLIVPLKGYKIHVCGASTTGMSPTAWITVKEFWTTYFTSAGAELVSYSVDVDCER